MKRVFTLTFVQTLWFCKPSEESCFSFFSFFFLYVRVETKYVLLCTTTYDKLYRIKGDYEEVVMWMYTCETYRVIYDWISLVLWRLSGVSSTLVSSKLTPQEKQSSSIALCLIRILVMVSRIYPVHYWCKHRNRCYNIWGFHDISTAYKRVIRYCVI